MALEQKLKLLPDKPGVYLMKDEEGNIIYVGKALSLKNRVRSYFQNQANHLPKTRAMVAKIADLDYIITDSEMEALILECNLIKEHRPYYNINLKDDKHYPYLKVTVREDFPRIMITRTMVKDGSRYFGPFTSAGAVHETLKLLKVLFPLRSCRRPKFREGERACLNLHIHRCLGPCQGEVSKERYHSMVRDLCQFLEGRQDSLLKRLKQEMLEASENLDFEKAKEARDKIQAIEKVIAKQKIISASFIDQDIIALVQGFGEVCVAVFFVRHGKLIGHEFHFLEGIEEMNEVEILTGFVKQFYAQVEFLPKEILLQHRLEEEEVIGLWLKEKRGSKVELTVPQRGEKVQLIEMVRQNAQKELEQRQAEADKERAMTEGAVTELSQELNLEKLPWRIECYDISNTQGTESVGSMVVFEGGRPLNKAYRRFKIKTVEGPNDFASMEEVIFRRFKRAKLAKSDDQNTAEEAQKFAKLPDLIIIDGGKGQLGAARHAMTSLGFGDIPTYGLAKQEEHLFTEGNKDPIILPRNSKALYLIQRIRDEAHRFALAYHRKLRTKRNLKSVLEEVPGIGSKRKQALYKHFGSLAKIRKASIEELAGVEGMTKGVAQELWEYLQEN